MGVNAFGQVTGFALLTGNTAYHAALWTNSGLPAIDLGTLGGSYSEGFGINASGQVAGSAYTSNGVMHAALWANGNPAVDLGTLGGPSSQANAINASGQVVGQAYTNALVQHAVLWTNSSAPGIDLGTLGGTPSQAKSINSSGQIAGWANTTGDVTLHAALWTNGGSPAVDLGTLGGPRSQATGINDSGEVVGFSDVTNDVASHAALWTNSTSPAVDLGTLGGANSQANGINASGQIVGSANIVTTNAAVSHGALWTNSASPAIDVNTLIPTNSGWVLATCYAISDTGEIVGSGTISGNLHAFALIPPPPIMTTNSWISILDGKWEANTNWSTGASPSQADTDDVITNAATKTVTIDSVTTNTPGTMTISNLIVSAPLGSTNTLFLNGIDGSVPLQVLNSLTVGSGGVLTVSGSALVAGSVSNAGMIQATGGTLEFFGLNTGTNDTLSGTISITNRAALLLSGTDSWTIASAVAYGGEASGGSIISSNGGAVQTVFLSDPAFCDNGGTLAVVGGNVINYGPAGADMTNAYVITGSGILTGNFGMNSYALFNQGTIASISGGTLMLDPHDALDFGGVQNASTIVVASGSTLSIRRTESAWDNPSTSYPTNIGAIFMQGGVLQADDATTTSTNRVFVNDTPGLIEGCGSFSNWTTVLNNGLILADCATGLTFSGIVTNNGTMRAVNGNVLEAYGTVVNNGTIDIINGGATNFHGGFVNNGTVLTADSVAISSIFVVTNDVDIQLQSVPGHTYQLQVSQTFTPTNWVANGASQSGTGNMLTFVDAGGATNVPTRFYRVLVTSP
ncbi:MAG TPA: hypothetical protein VMP11_03605 [Verrucomicrobiae bacterium]|nr:hypothetical protein [Verrucomicrobiae bacterium]